MDRATELLQRQMRVALAGLRPLPGAPEAALLDALEEQLEHGLVPALAEGDFPRAVTLARQLERRVAELPLPEAELSPALRAEVLALQVELLRTAAGLHHALATLV